MKKHNFTDHSGKEEDLCGIGQKIECFLSTGNVKNFRTMRNHQERHPLESFNKSKQFEYWKLLRSL